MGMGSGRKGASVVVTTILLIGIAAIAAGVLYFNVYRNLSPYADTGSILEDVKVIKVIKVNDADPLELKIQLINVGTVDANLDRLYIENANRSLVTVRFENMPDELSKVDWGTDDGILKPGDQTEATIKLPQELALDPLYFKVVTTRGSTTSQLYLLYIQEPGIIQPSEPGQGVITTFSISGTVKYDPDYNWLTPDNYPLTERPVTIELYKGDFTGPPTGDPFLRTETDPSGKYSFQGLNKGYYTLYLLMPAANGTGYWLNSTDYIKPLVVKTDVTQDFGLYFNKTSVPLYKIWGYVFEDNPLIPNPGGYMAPGEIGLSGWVVTCRTSEGSILSYTTGTDGSYIFEIPSGVYTVSEVIKPGWVNKNDWSHVITVTNDNMRRDFGNEYVGFSPTALYSIGGLVYNDSDNNGIFAGNDTYLEGWIITYRIGSGPSYQAPLTGSNGEFLIDRLDPGTYTIEELLYKGWTNTTERILTKKVGPDNWAGIAIGNYYIGGGGPSQILSISGYVYNDTDQNGDYNRPPDEPLFNWTVYLKDSDGMPLSFTRTDARGLYIFTYLQPGNYQVELRSDANPPGYQNTTSRIQAVELINSSLTDINFGFKKSGAAAAITIYGNIYNDTDLSGSYDPLYDDPLENWTVFLYNGFYNGSGVPIYSTFSNSSGMYSFSGLPSGNYTVIIVLEAGYANTTSRLYYVNASGGYDFGNQKIPSADLYYVRGYVFNDTDRDGIYDLGYDPPLANWTVYLNDNYGLPIAVFNTTSNGSYVFTDMEAGSYSVGNVLKSGWSNSTPTVVEITITSAPLQNIDFGNYLTGTPPMYVISGYVYNDTADPIGTYNPGQDGPLSGWAVWLYNGTYNGSGTPVSIASTNGSGFYNFTGLFSGTYTVISVLSPGYTNTTSRMQVVPLVDSVGNVNFGNRKVGSPSSYNISGYVFNDTDRNGVRDPYDQGLSGWYVYLLDETGMPINRTSSAATGLYGFTQLSSGTYTVFEDLRAGWANSTPRIQVVTISSSNITDLNFGNYNVSLNVTTPRYNISGIKFNDKNGDGIYNYSAGESGLRDWGIFLYAGVYTGGTDQFPIAFNNTSSNNSSNFIFTNLAPGTYTVVELPKAGYTNTTPRYQIVTITNRNVDNINFGNQKVTTPPVYTISGIKFNDIDRNGIYENWSDNTLSGWWIYINDATGLPVFRNQTNATGNFTFINLPAGTYTIYEQMQTNWTNSTPRVVNVTITNSNVSNVMFGNYLTNISARYYINVFVFYDMNGNGAYNSNQDYGMAGWTIWLYNGTYSGGFDLPIRSAVTNSTGNCTFTNLPPGTYTVLELINSSWNLTNPPRNKVITITNQSVYVTYGNKDQSPPKLYSISGYVFNDTDRNGIYDFYDNGLNWSIYLADANRLPLSNLTAALGNFTFQNLANGTYTIFENISSGWSNSTPTSYTITITNANVTNIAFGNYMWSKVRWTISGLVFNDTNKNGIYDAGDQPLPGWSVWLYNNSYIATKTPFQMVVTNANGIYLFTGLSNGSYSVVEVLQPGYTNSTVRLVYFSLNQSRTVDFGNYRIATPQTYSISGYVFNDTDRNGIYDFYDNGLNWSVCVNDDKGLPISSTSALNGYYSFGGLSPGNYALYDRFANSNWTNSTPQFVQVTIVASSIIDLNFGNYLTSTPPVYTISGLVFNDTNKNGIFDTGEPSLSSWYIELYNSSGALVSQTVTSGSGEYYFSGLPNGSYRVIEYYDPPWVNTTPRIMYVTVTNQSLENINFGNYYNLTVVETYTISGLVFNDTNKNGIYDAGDPPLPGWTIKYTNSTGYTEAALTDSQGKYSFINIPKGNYTVELLLKSGWLNSTTTKVNVSLTGSDITNLDFGAYYNLFNISGYVFLDVNNNGIYDVGDYPLGNWNVTLVGAKSYQATTNGSGYYQFINVDGGIYNMSENMPIQGWTNTTRNSFSITVNQTSNVNFGNRRSFVVGQYLTWSRSTWASDNTTLTTVNFNTVYAPQYFVKLGSDTLYYLSFSNNIPRIKEYLQNNGPASNLTQTYQDPPSGNNPGGIFGAHLLALQFNVDFCKKQVGAFGSRQDFSRLTYYNVPADPLSGKTVAEILNIANRVFGGELLSSLAPGCSFETLYNLIISLNNAFSGSDMSWANSHLF